MNTRAVVLTGICLWPCAISQSQTTPDRQQRIETHSRKAQEYLQKGQLDLASGEYRAVLALDPNNVDARGNLGVAYFFQNDFAKAAPELRRAVKLRPNLWKIQALLGISEKRLGQSAAAQADLEKAFPQLQEEKLHIQAGLELIEVYYASGQLDKAASIAGALRQIAPTNTDVLYTAHRIYSDLAGETTLAMSMVAPRSARMHQIMAQELARQGNMEEAIAHYREALQIDPRLPGVRFELAEALNLSPSASDQEQAEKEYRVALADNPFDEKANCRLAEFALRGADLEGALALYSRALQLQPNDAEANLGVGKTLSQLHRTSEALRYLKRAAELEPFTAVTHYRLSLVYRETGRSDEAQKELAEFQRLKEMKERLKQVYQDMRLQPVKQERIETETAK